MNARRRMPNARADVGSNFVCSSCNKPSSPVPLKVERWGGGTFAWEALPSSRCVGEYSACADSYGQAAGISLCRRKLSLLASHKIKADWLLPANNDRVDCPFSR
jgi:hypothetical protein